MTPLGGNGNPFSKTFRYQQERERMVREQIEARGVGNHRVLEAMREVPRQAFLPESLHESAYKDHPLPIGFDQTISQPYIVARMLEILNPRSSDRVLEIGAGCGYVTALLCKLAAHVYAMEIVDELAAQAEANLEDLFFRNFTFRTGNGSLGWPDAAPFDSIILSAAPETLPQALIDQLGENARLVAPVGTRNRQHLVFIEKRLDAVHRRTLDSVRFVPMQSTEKRS